MFARSETDDLIADTIRRFAADEIRPRLREFEQAGRIAVETRARFVSLGFDGVDAPERLGGVDLGARARVQVNQLLAEADAGAAIALDRLGAALYAIDAVLSAHENHPILEKLQQPDASCALVFDPSAGLGSGKHVSGDIAWAPCSDVTFLVGIGPKGAWILDTGFEIAPVRGAALHAAGSSRIRYAGVPLCATDDERLASRALARTRLYYASLLWGVLTDATKYSREYAMERVAFGKPIAHHQGLAFLIVDMFIAVERVGQLVMDAAAQIDAGDGRAAAASAFVDAVEIARFVGPSAVQILGGHGFMRDFPMEKAMRDSRALGLLACGVDLARTDAGEWLVASEGSGAMA